MKFGARLLALFFSFLPALVFADVELRRGSVAHFGSIQEGAEIQSANDDFIEHVSGFDRAVRMKTKETPSTAEFLQFLRGNVIPWSDAEMTRVAAVIAKIRPGLELFGAALPARVTLIKTTGAEGRQFYTRDSAVIFPQQELRRAKGDAFEKLIAHELFHILSRKNPALRERLFHTIGFAKCPEIRLPPELDRRRITNPDAPRLDQFIRLQTDGANVVALPLTFSRTEKYDPTRGAELFDYLQFNFLVARSLKDLPTGKLLSPHQVSNFYQQVGRNTDYIIHPEEIMADNFAMLVRNQTDVPSPEILRRMRAILTGGNAKAGAITR
jgi:hypothetical protein